MFGRRRKNRETDIEPDHGTDTGAEDPGFEDSGFEDSGYDDYTDDYTGGAGSEEGPFDIETIGEDAAVASRLDLGSVLVPLPPGGQIQVEMAPNGTPQNVHLVTQNGRITVSAYAAPKSPGQWREVAAELSETLRNDNAVVSMESGPWGRELHGTTPNADLRFIGVDGPRWMIRCVVAGPAGNTGADSELVAVARTVVAGTVVRRGSEPHPVRTPLPVVLPEALANQLAAAQQQQVAARQQASQQQTQQGAQQVPQQGVQQQQPPTGAVPAPSRAPGPPPTPPAQRPQPPRRGESGSAMQQLGF